MNPNDEPVEDSDPLSRPWIDLPDPPKADTLKRGRQTSLDDPSEAQSGQTRALTRKTAFGAAAGTI